MLITRHLPLRRMNLTRGDGGRKPLAEVAAVDGGEAAGLGLGVCGDEEIGDQMLTRAAGLAVAFEGEAGEVGSGGGDGIVDDGEAGEELSERGFVGGGWGEFGEGDGTDDEQAFGGGVHEALQPAVVPRLRFDDVPEH